MDRLKYKLLTIDPYDNEPVDAFEFHYLEWYSLIPILEEVILYDDNHIYKLQIFTDEDALLQSSYIVRPSTLEAPSSIIRDHRNTLAVSPIHEPYVVKKNDKYVFTVSALRELHEIGLNLMRLADEED